MKKIALFLLAAALLACCVAAAAAPSFYGPTGLFEVPTASSLAFGNLNLFANFAKTTGDNTTIFGGNVGVGFGLEAGLGVVSDSDNDVLVNAKWNVLHETLITPGIAVGAIDISDSGAALGGFAPYIVASKSFCVPTKPWRIAGHLGYTAGQVNKVFAAGELVIDPRFTVIGETFGGHVNGGVRYAPLPDLRVDLAFINGNFGTAVSYNIGLK